MTPPSDQNQPLPLAALAAGLGAVAVYALAVEPFLLELTRIEVSCPRLPAALDGLTILLLADTHIRRRGPRERMLARLVDSLPLPDIAVVAGDLIQGLRGIGPSHAFVRDHVRARHACYGIFGNAEHKLRWQRRAALADLLTDAGLTLLVNRNTPLTIGETTITVAGTDDPYYGHADLEKTLMGHCPDRFCLLLAHSPQIVAPAARAGVDLMLSGHTHGGQVRLPLIGALRAQNPLGRRMDAGLFDRARLTDVLGRDPGGDIRLYVSRGIGVANLSRYPIYPRFLCRPEVAWLTLRRA